MLREWTINLWLPKQEEAYSAGVSNTWPTRGSNAARKHQNKLRFFKNNKQLCDFLNSMFFKFKDQFFFTLSMRPVRPFFKPHAAPDSIWVWDPRHSTYASATNLSESIFGLTIGSENYQFPSLGFELHIIKSSWGSQSRLQFTGDHDQQQQQHKNPKSKKNFFSIFFFFLVDDDFDAKRCPLLLHLQAHHRDRKE